MVTKAPKLAPSTRDLYEYLLRCHVLPRFGSRPPGQITGAEIQGTIPLWEWIGDGATTFSY